MSETTIELRNIVQAMAGQSFDTGYSGIDDAIDAAVATLFNFNYPVFDTDTKARLERNFCIRYWMREIAYDTVPMFQLRLRNELNTIMPYYNQLYATTDMILNPFNDVDYTRESQTGNESINQTSETTNSNTTQQTENTTDFNETRKHSDTPQSSIQNLQDGKYLSDAEINENSTEVNGLDKSLSNSDRIGLTKDSSQQKFIETIKGKQGTQSYASLLKEYRETFLNIDRMVLDDLEKLFICVW